MQIIIDTNKDSKEDIQKAIDFLSKFLETAPQGEFEVPQETGNAMQMFDNDKKEKKPSGFQTYDV